MNSILEELFNEMLKLAEQVLLRFLDVFVLLSLLGIIIFLIRTYVLIKMYIDSKIDGRNRKSFFIDQRRFVEIGKEKSLLMAQNIKKLINLP